MHILGMVGTTKSKSILYVANLLPTKKGDKFMATYKASTKWPKSAVDYDGTIYNAVDDITDWDPKELREFVYDPKKHVYIV